MLHYRGLEGGGLSITGLEDRPVSAQLLSNRSVRGRERRGELLHRRLFRIPDPDKNTAELNSCQDLIPTISLKKLT